MVYEDANQPEAAGSDLAHDPNPSSAPGTEESPKADVRVPPPASPVAEPAFWLDRALAAARTFLQWLSRPRVRLAVIGVILLVIGGLFMTSSVWTLPLVVAGALMVAIAWIGCRLDGRFAVEWGETGTQLEFRAQIKAPQFSRPADARTPTGSHELLRRVERATESAEIIDGEAQTVEIEVAELEALIAAVETTNGEIAQADASARAERTFRVARGGPSSPDAVG